MNPQVTYHLKGFDQENDHGEPEDLEPMDYTNLSGGKYQFI